MDIRPSHRGLPATKRLDGLKQKGIIPSLLSTRVDIPATVRTVLDAVVADCIDRSPALPARQDGVYRLVYEDEGKLSVRFTPMWAVVNNPD